MVQWRFFFIGGNTMQATNEQTHAPVAEGAGLVQAQFLVVDVNF